MKSIPQTILVSLIILFCACNPNTREGNAEDKTLKDLAQYVDPFIGTDRMGHVYPGATAPFGMVQLSPQTHFLEMYTESDEYNNQAYEYCAGYQYRDSTIIGFAHTNFSGTGHSDLGDILLMPCTSAKLPDVVAPSDGRNGIFSSFSHDREEASPGYYKVFLDSYGIQAELTASERVGFHKYTFPASDSARIILDMVYNVYHHDDKNVWTFLRVENDTLVTGYRQTYGWARTRKVFFAMAFSKPFKSYGQKNYDHLTYKGFYRRFNQDENFPEMAGKNIRAYFDFNTKRGEEIKVKVALSSVSTSGAMANMKAEIPHWDFEKTRAETRRKWDEELAKVEVKMIDDKDLTTFYTALYHTCLSPILYEDIDGSYMGLDQNIHQSVGFTNYTIFSLWDTYRALHPLFNLIQPERNNDMIWSMLAHFDQSVHHMLPIWSHYANENWCMIGYHACSVIADAMVKGVGDFDRKRALDAAVETSSVPYFEGIGDYIKYGYVPDDKSHSSVSKTLEYAYDDWCIAQIAKHSGDKQVEETFLHRSRNFVNVYNPTSGFMHPRISSGAFRTDFDPMDTYGQGFIEGNAWNYGLYVPQDIEGMIAMMGGAESFSRRLDSLFTMHIDDKYIEKHEDITRDGIIGNYVHGNEPGHHIAYLYNWTGEPYKTQSRVRMIMDSMYGTGPDGLCGNDDAGQMSAWYVFSSLGFYPVTPGSPYYAIGSPKVSEAFIRLGNGKTLHIISKNQGKENIYVKSVILNGKTVEGHLLSHAELMKGGELIFEMSSEPKK